MFIRPTQFLKKVEKALTQTGRVALTGVGGIGKTSLAVEIFNHYRDQGTRVLWIAASKEEQIINVFVKIDQKWTGNYVENLESADRERIAESCKKAIEDWNGDCLLVFDDVADLEVARKWFPRTPHARILITTQLSITGDVARAMKVPLLSQEEGAELLLKRAGRLQLDQTLDECAPADREAALQLAGKSLLGGLPLALTSAGAYMEEEALSPAQFLALYEPRRAEILSHIPRVQRRKHPSVLTTVTMAFDRLGETQAGAASTPAGILAQFCAYLAPEPAPERLFETKAFQELIRTHSSLPAGKMADAVRKAIQRAADYSLLQREADKSGDTSVNTAAVHHIVQECLQLLQEQGYAGMLEPGLLARQAASAIEEVLAEAADANDGPAFSRIYPHALQCETVYQEDDALRAESASRSGYSLETFFNEVQIQRGLASGVWEMFSSYSRFREIEHPAGLARLLRLLATLDRICTDPLTARQGFACIYFAVHYWWDCYFDTPLGGQRLLQAWQQNHPAGEDQQLIEAMKTFHENYPYQRDYAGRAQKQEQWGAVAAAILKIQKVLRVSRLAADPQPTARYLRGITLSYLAEALQFIPPQEATAYYPEKAARTDSADPILSHLQTLTGLYKETEAQFEKNEDVFSQQWTRYEIADACTEIAGQIPAGRRDLEPARQKARQVIRDAIETDPDEDVDRGELVANGYRLLADLAGLEGDPEKRQALWGYRCMALLAAGAFLLSDKDAYTLAFYGEQLERLRDDLKRLKVSTPEEQAHALAVGSFIRAFWHVYWKSPLPKTFADAFLAALETPEPERLLVPPAPGLKEVTAWEKEDASTEERQRLQETLEKMPGLLKRRAGTLGTFPLPPEAAEVAKWLLAASQGFPEGSA